MKLCKDGYKQEFSIYTVYLKCNTTHNQAYYNTENRDSQIVIHTMIVLDKFQLLLSHMTRTFFLMTSWGTSCGT